MYDTNKLLLSVPRIEQRLNDVYGANYQIQMNSETDDPDWDAFLANTPGGHYMQSSLWAKMKALSGWHAVRITINAQNKIAAGAQLLLRALPLVGAIGYVPKGVLAPPDDPFLLGYAVDAIQQVATDNRIQHLTIQPPGNGHFLAQHLQDKGFRLNPKIGTATATVLMDLSKNPDNLLADMRKSTRTNIRKGQARGIVVREGSEKDLEHFYALLKVASQRKKFPIHTKKYYNKMWRVLSPRGHIKLFLAEHQSELVSGMLAIPFGDTLYTHVSAWSGNMGDYKPNEVLEWSAMMWAQAEGHRYYDFEGIDTTAAKAVMQGEYAPDLHSQTTDRMVTGYKLGFGGQTMILPGAYEYVYNPLLRWAHQDVLPVVRHWPMVKKAIKTLTRPTRQPL